MGNSYGLKGKGIDLSHGPPKRKRDVVRIPPAIDTPLVPAENAPSSSGWHSNVALLLNFMMSFLGTVFSWIFPRKDIMRMPSAIETPFVPAGNAPSSSGWHSNVKHLVHDLNPTCHSNNPNLTIVFFHGITFGTNDEWKETWTTCPTNNGEENICWPEKWLPEDLNNNVRILSLSYDSNIVGSVHNDVTEIGKNVIQSLVTNSRCDNLLYLWTH